jgi:hypothetical protein
VAFAVFSLDSWRSQPRWRPGKVYMPSTRLGLWQDKMVMMVGSLPLGFVFDVPEETDICKRQIGPGHVVHVGLGGEVDGDLGDGDDDTSELDTIEAGEYEGEELVVQNCKAASGQTS